MQTAFDHIELFLLHLTMLVLLLIGIVKLVAFEIGFYGRHVQPPKVEGPTAPMKPAESPPTELP